MRQSLLLPVLALVVVAALLVTQIVLLVTALQAENRSEQATSQAHLVLRLALDAETGQRGYLISGNPIFLQPYDHTAAHIGSAFKKLAKLAAQNPAQAARVSAMKASYSEWLDEAKIEIALLEQGKDVQPYFSLHKSKDLMDVVRVEDDDFIHAETVLHAQRQNAAQRAYHHTVALTIISLVGVSLLFGVVSRRQMLTLVAEYDHALTSEVEARELLSATLLGIGDAVLVTDQRGCVTLLNSVAERLTGWTNAEAQGQDSRNVFPIINETTRKEVVSPIARVLQDGLVVGLANHTLLVRRDGTELPIDDSGAPVRDSSGKLVGVVLVFRDISERHAADRNLRLALRREHQVAATLQRSLLQSPPPRAFPGILLGSVYEPARLEGDADTMEVGGDFLDAFALSETQVALVVGDVSGKGLVAAARTAEVLYTLRGLLRESGQPDIAVTRLNRILCDSQAIDPQAEGFICLAVAVLDRETNSATFCVAGAEPPLIIRADSSAEEVALHGIPLSVIPEVEYETATRNLGMGDKLVLVTDGITEARRQREFLGWEGFSRLAGEAPSEASPATVAQTILAGATEFAGGTLRDDACILVAQFETAEPQTAI
jgi:PAS domain S-box-containing protein